MFKNTTLAQSFVNRMKNQVHPFAYIWFGKMTAVKVQIGNYNWTYPDVNKGFNAFMKISWGIGVKYNPRFAKFWWICQRLAYKLTIEDEDDTVSCVNSRKVLESLA